MIPVSEKVFPSPGSSFCVQRLNDRRLHFNWHYHPELELVVIKDGHGQVRAGDMLDSFAAPAALLMGPGLPHGFASEGGVDGWIIQFDEGIFSCGPSEFDGIVDLIVESRRGLRFSEVAAHAAVGMDGQEGLGKWIDVLKALDFLSRDTGRDLCSFAKTDMNIEGFDAVVSAVFNEAEKTYRLGELSRRTGMSVTGFSKTFKRRFGLSFTEYLHSIRINTAKKLLIQTSLYIDDICYECGFNNVSFFNRKFKELAGMTPTEYRKFFAQEGQEKLG